MFFWEFAALIGKIRKSIFSAFSGARLQFKIKKLFLGCELKIRIRKLGSESLYLETRIFTLHSLIFFL